MATRRKAPFLVFHLFISLLLAGLTLHGFTFAEVVTDSSFGVPRLVGSGVLPDGRVTDYHITDTLGKRAGQNLFHSFSSFNVGTGQSATFTGPSGIQNVVSRVTGTSYSSIDGTLRSTIPGANLYFLNPLGVFFGPNASLDVKGSFHVSTADYLSFDDGVRFYSAPGPADQVLSTASPAAFGFLTANPGLVYAVQSFLEVPAGETLSIVGGEIVLLGAYLGAPGGRINLASVALPGEVIPSPPGEVPYLRVQPVNASGALKLDASTLDVSDYFNGRPAGTILIRAGRLVLDHGSWVTADNYGDAAGGGVDIRTGSLEVSGGSSVSADSVGRGKGGQLAIEATNSVRLSDTYSAISSAAWTSGDAGSIALSTPHLLIENEAAIYGDSFSDGRGGDVSIVAGKLTLLSGGSISSSASGGTGDGGNLSITAWKSISISGSSPNGVESSLVSRTIDAGDTGRIEIITPVLDIADSGVIGVGTILTSSSNPLLGGTGNAADIVLTVGTINLSGGGRILNNAFGTTGNGGDISVRASESATIAGTGSGIFTRASALGNAGDIFLSAPNLVLSNGASIGTETLGDGRAGNIELTVLRLTLSGGATISSGSISGSGRGGNIHVSATDAISLSGLFSDISASTAGFGDGGNITISTKTLTLQEQAAIYADTDGYEGIIGSGQGGDIGINVTSLAMSGGSRISSSTYDSTGDGGHVTVQADNDISLTGTITGIGSVSSGDGKGGDIQLGAAELRLTDGAQISASSKGKGDAGNIDIAVTGSFISRNSKVSTSSKNADGGNINITAPYMVHLKDSEITASVGGGASTVGGNISIDPQFVILDHSKIIANAYEGKGGNIQIVSNVFLADPFSVVDASSALGIDGTVDIRAPITEISGTLVPLGEDFISAFELLREPCMARIRGGKYSSFIVTGREGLPVEPGSLLPSPMP
jgi:filamentous hemagglutinin family protein